jgi:hypothetical protein
MNKKRVGKFNITAELIQDIPEVAQLVQNKCFIIRCEHDWLTDAFEYTALSDDFDELPTGEAPPTYDWQIEETDRDGLTAGYKIEAIRR